MNTRRRPLRCTATGIALVVALTAVLVPATGAYAGSPIPGTAYDGASLHGRYTVDLTATCPGVAAASLGTGVCYDDHGPKMPMMTLSLDLYTHPQPGSGCKASGYEFEPTTVKPDGSFSATGQFSSTSPQLTFTVQGTFLSLVSVHGTITGNLGCGTDSFTINLHTTPLIPTAPCALLIEVHAPRTIMGGLAVSEDEGTFTATGGYCYLLFGHIGNAGAIGGGFSFIVASSVGGANVTIGEEVQTWAHQRPLAGLGTGATLYYNNYYNAANKQTGSVTSFEVEFHRSGVWASLTPIPPPIAHPGACSCFSAAGFAVREAHVVQAAKALLSVL